MPSLWAFAKLVNNRSRNSISSLPRCSEIGCRGRTDIISVTFRALLYLIQSISSVSWFESQLAAFAVAINKTGLATLACRKLEKIVSGKKILLMFFIAGIACLSGTLIPVHIAFIPILIPPLLLLFNELKADRRQAASLRQ